MKTHWVLYGITALAGILAIIEQFQTRKIGLYFSLFIASAILSFLYYLMMRKQNVQPPEPIKDSGDRNKPEVPNIQKKEDN